VTTATAPKPQPRSVGHYFTDDDRADLAAGYRHLADLIESGQAPVPTSPSMSFFVNGEGDEQPAAARDLMRALGGGTYAKEASGSGSYLTLEGACGGVPVRIYVARDAVCERVVVGEEKVQVPAQPAQPARVEVREIVEWRCHPLLEAAGETADTVEVTA
jgi:hypothetical protein